MATGVFLALQNDPFTVAKSVATHDQLSGGRVIFGVGAGRFDDIAPTIDAFRRIPSPDERFRLLDTYAPHLAELAS